MTMEDFDDITMHFLNNKRTDYALAVFRDMMLLGESRESKTDSMLAKVQQRFAALMRSTDNTKQVDDLTLHTMEYLPRRYQNKFFYAKWLKKLIGMGELDHAAQVIELMYERGVNPDAKHLNGLIGAWLRQDDNIEHRHKAEELAWAMVQKRLVHVRERRLARSPDVSIPQVSVLDEHEMQYRWANIQDRRSRWSEDLSKDNKKASPPQVPTRTENDLVESTPLFQLRRTPSATVETFCLLLAFYVRKGDSYLISTFRNFLPHAELHMNSVIMNQLLYAVWEQSGHKRVWRLFEVLSTRVLPDIETWICLWECMKTDLIASSNLDVYSTDKGGFPTPRQMFIRMQSWVREVPRQERRRAMQDIENDTYNDIIRCFLMARDLEGGYVAMHFLTHNLDVWPSSKTARMLLLQVSQMNTDRARRHRRILKPGKVDLEDKMAKTAAVLELVTQHRREQMKLATGKDFDEMSAHAQAEEGLRTMLLFLYTLIRRRKGEVVAPGVGIEAAKKEMLGQTRDEDAYKLDVEESLDLWKGN